MYLSHVDCMVRKPGSQFGLWKEGNTVQFLLQNIRSGGLGEGEGLGAERKFLLASSPPPTTLSPDILSLIPSQHTYPHVCIAQRIHLSPQQKSYQQAVASDSSERKAKPRKKRKKQPTRWLLWKTTDKSMSQRPM